MSDTTAIPQADAAAAEQPASSPLHTLATQLDTAVYGYGRAVLELESAREAASNAETVMLDLYRQFQAEQRGGK